MALISPVIQAKIFSTLGNPSSIVPLGIKDFSNASAMTAGSYITGKEEGADRFIDEFGSEALWLFGIPFFKGVINTLLIKFMQTNQSTENLQLQNSCFP